MEEPVLTVTPAEEYTDVDGPPSTASQRVQTGNSLQTIHPPGSKPKRCLTRFDRYEASEVSPRTSLPECCFSAPGATGR